MLADPAARKEEDKRKMEAKRDQHAHIRGQKTKERKDIFFPGGRRLCSKVLTNVFRRHKYTSSKSTVLEYNTLQQYVNEPD